MGAYRCQFQRVHASVSCPLFVIPCSSVPPTPTRWILTFVFGAMSAHRRRQYELNLEQTRRKHKQERGIHTRNAPR